MKRARIVEDFNPVYPYDTPNAPAVPFITPPFTSSDGLQEKPPGILSLNYKDPIATKNGALTLKLGSGLDINDEGELTSNLDSITPPLFKENKTMGLAFNDPLTLQNNQLVVAYTSPLTLQHGKIALQYGSPLTLNNDKLTLNFNAPLTDINHTLSLRFAQPLFVNNYNELAFSAEAPLNTAAGTLRLQSAAPLGIADSTLRVLYSSPLYLQNNFLTLAIERPLAITSQGKLTLQVSQPLKLEDNSLAVSVTSPIKVVDSSIGLASNPPFTVDDSGLSLSTGDGLTVSNSKLQVNIGAGLHFSNGAITASGTVLTASLPLVFSNNQLSLNIGGGLRYSTTYKSIAVKYDIFKGLDIDYYGFLVPKLGNGLQFDKTGNFEAKLGKHLQFDGSGKIDVVFPNPNPDTLWTSPDPLANCTLFTELDAQVWLSLVKTGGMVHGFMSFKPLKGLAMGPSINYNFLSIIVQFNENGVRINASPSSTDNEFQGTLAPNATWGYRVNNTTDTNVTNARAFMPNSTRYPRGGTALQNQLFGSTYINGDYNTPVPYTVKFNTVSSGYSIVFKWGIVRLQQTNLPDCTFSYITEE